MKKEKLYNAITNISDENIKRADTYGQKVTKIKRKMWLPSIAAILVVAIVIGVVLWPGKDAIIISANAIFEAEYPTLSSEYPGGERIDSATAQQLSPFFAELIQKSLSDSGKENGVISPLSLYMAMSILAESTAGESQKQILDLLKYDSIEQLRTGSNAIWNAVYNTHKSSTRLLANSVWLDNSVEYNNVTMKNIADYYYASSFSGNIGSEQMNKVMQAWINQNTKDVLKNQVSDLELEDQTLYAIISTVYFKSSWESTFTTKKTVQDTFHGAQGDVSAYFMKKSTKAAYYWGEGFSAISLELQGGDIMWIILPDEGTSPEEVLGSEQALSLMTSQKKTASNKILTVHMTIPRFDVEENGDLSGVLKEMGVTQVFDMYNADMSPVLKDGVLPSGDGLYVTEVQHGVRVKIDEEGCEGAAYTVIPSNPEATAPPDDEVDFTVDRPFIFAVTDRNSLPIFAGIVNNP